MGSESVATVLRQSGAAVRLIVARPVHDSSSSNDNGTAVIPTDTLDEYLETLCYRLMEMDAYLETAVVTKATLHFNYFLK